MSLDLLRLPLAVLLAAALVAVGGGFLVRLVVARRQLMIDPERLRRWQRRLRALRWGTWLLLAGSLVAVVAAWPRAALWAALAFVVVSLLLHRALAIVQVWLEQAEGGRSALI